MVPLVAGFLRLACFHDPSVHPLERGQARPHAGRVRFRPCDALSSRSRWLALSPCAGCGGGGGSNSARPRHARARLHAERGARRHLRWRWRAARDTRARRPKLTIRQPTASSDSLKLLAAGRADIAVADIHDLGLARERGEDLVGVGALVQRPLASVIAGPGVTRPRQLEGKRVGVTGVPSDDAVLRAVVAGRRRRPAEGPKTITIGFSAVPSLLTGKVAAATAFWNVEGVTLRRRGLATHEFRVDSYGAPRYPELVLVARRDTVHERPGAPARHARGARRRHPRRARRPPRRGGEGGRRGAGRSRT